MILEENFLLLSFYKYRHVRGLREEVYKVLLPALPTLFDNRSPIGEHFTQQVVDQGENAITPQLAEQIRNDIFSMCHLSGSDIFK